MGLNKITKTMQDASTHVSTQPTKLGDFLAPPGTERRLVARFVNETMIQPTIETAKRLAHVVSGIIKVVVGALLLIPLKLIGTLARGGALLASFVTREPGQSRMHEGDISLAVARGGTKIRNFPEKLLRSACYDFAVAVHGTEEMRRFEDPLWAQPKYKRL